MKNLAPLVFNCVPVPVFDRVIISNFGFGILPNYSVDAKAGINGDCSGTSKGQSCDCTWTCPSTLCQSVNICPTKTCPGRT
jgi:hypothetical protein